MSEAVSTFRANKALPAAAGARPISVIGWSIATVTGVALWAVAYLLIRG